MVEGNKSMNDITIVTSFFDIGRGENEINNMSRSNEKYVEYFKTWARIKNKIVIYTEKKMAEPLYNVRKEFGRQEETQIVVVENMYSLFPDIFSKMKKIGNDENFLRFRYYDKAMSNQAKYCYLVFLQYWIIKDVVERGLVEDQLAWIDLGFNHGLKYYTNPSEFNFYWRYSFGNKINCFTLTNPDDISIIDSLQFQKDCFMGGFIGMPKEKAVLLWDYIYEAEKAMLMLDCMDDDQHLLLMAYRAHPDDFLIKTCEWFEPLRLCGCENLSHRTTNKEKKKLVKTIKELIYVIIKGKHRDFLIRSYQRACKYH